MRPCLTCGVLVDGSYCWRHHPERLRRRVTPNRQTRKQRDFRQAVLAT